MITDDERFLLPYIVPPPPEMAVSDLLAELDLLMARAVLTKVQIMFPDTRLASDRKEDR